MIDNMLLGNHKLNNIIMNIKQTPNSSKYSTTRYNQSQSTSSKHIASRRDSIYNPISVSNITPEKNPQLFKKNNNETLCYNGFKMHHISQLANQRKEVQCFTIRHCELLNKSGFNASETIYLAKINKRTQEIALDYRFVE